MTSKVNDKQARRRTIQGFPIEGKFLTPESIAEYFCGATITCLRCGKRYRTLGVHLKTIHSMEPDEYRDMYGIPWSYGLSCASTTQLHSDNAKMKIETGVFVPSKEQAKIARMSPRRNRHPVQSVWTYRALEKMNAGKTGEDKKRRDAASKRGTPEFKEKMRARPQTEQAKKMLSTYWKGKKQTDDHVFKRTGYHKKAP